jgi:hypothetical protein
MSGARIDLNLSLPCDPRLAESMRQLAVHAAATCGCPASDGESFGRSVERAVREALAQRRAGDRIAVKIRRDEGPVEVVVDNRHLVLPV